MLLAYSPGRRGYRYEVWERISRGLPPLQELWLLSSAGGRPIFSGTPAPVAFPSVTPPGEGGEGLEVTLHVASPLKVNGVTAALLELSGERRDPASIVAPLAFAVIRLAWRQASGSGLFFLQLTYW